MDLGWGLICVVGFVLGAVVGFGFRDHLHVFLSELLDWNAHDG